MPMPQENIIQFRYVEYTGNAMMTTVRAAAQIDDDPQKYFCFAAYLLILVVAALSLFGFRIQSLNTMFKPQLISELMERA